MATAARILDRELTIAGPAFNRWLVPPAALAIHLCIGMAYGFSVFWIPMTHLLSNTPDSCSALSFWALLVTTWCNWTVAGVTPVFEVFIAVLGISAAIWGSWLEHAGPRKAGFIAALCWGGGLILAGLAVALHQLWLVGTFYFKLQHANEFMRLAREEIGCRIAIHRSLCVNVAVFSSLNSSKSLSAI